jgi:hypothetical protein
VKAGSKLRLVEIGNQAGPAGFQFSHFCVSALAPGRTMEPLRGFYVYSGDFQVL